ncbi:protein DGS1, mitochondrial [Henckelia pumila]|uniref:protein DGS1, mitochondrial n=1 Tax=Henckelia pumila TaxID=405737 RepID=UPI003C6E895D
MSVPGMEVSAENESPLPSNDTKALFSLYSSYLYNRIRTLFPIPINYTNSLLSKVASIHGYSGRSRRKTCLPIPLPPVAAAALPDISSGAITEAHRIFHVLEDIKEHSLQNLRSIQKNLGFWQSKAQSSNNQKAYFMICQRGPCAFMNGSVQLIRDYIADGSGMQNFYGAASSHISERIHVLTSLRYFLATFLAEVYMAVDRVGEDLVKDLEKSLPSLLVAINDIFLKLEASIGHFHANRQSGSSVDGSFSLPLMFTKLPAVNQEGSQWTDCETRDAINLIYENLHRLNSYLSVLVSKHCKPKKITLYWMRYSCGALGFAFCSVWILRHSRLMGSSDIDNWIREAKDSTISFWKDHVEQPILSIRDELFETFRKRQKSVMELEELQLTSDSLHRMLLTFSEQTVGKKFPENASDQQMLEIVMTRYEKELMHPIQGLLSGELGRALLIQVQKLKLDIQEAMLELDQILRANEINFAILAALPAFFLSLVLAMLVRAWFKKDTRAEGQGRVARIQRRILLAEIERALEELQSCEELELEKDAQCMYGLVLYFLDSLHCAVERHAEAAGEWTCLRKDIVDLAKPSLESGKKISIISRMGKYDCLLPSSTRQ